MHERISLIGPVSRHRNCGVGGSRLLSNRYGDAAKSVGWRPAFVGK